MLTGNLGLSQDLIDAVSQIVEASCSARKMEKEELHPNQVKLDKNKNGKLDADDFKKLRKEEETDEGFVSNAQRKAVWASKNEKGVKEEYEDFDEELYLEDYSLEEIEDFMQTEDFEQLDELSKATLGSYVKKASDDKAHSQTQAQSEYDRGVNMQLRGMGDQKMRDTFAKQNFAKSKEYMDNSIKRTKGISKAVGKLTKEQVEEIEVLAAKHGLGE